MRLMIISGSLPPMKCGVGDYVALLARALAERNGLEVAVVTDQRAHGDGCGRAEVFPIVHNWSIADVERIFLTIRRWKPDLVHMQFGSVGYAGRIMPWLLPILMWIRGIRVVQTWHEYSPDLLRLIRHLPNTLTPGGLIVVKPEYRQLMWGWHRALIAHKPYRYIPNASAIPRVTLTPEERQAVRQRLGGDQHLVAFFGFANARKGMEQLFEIVDPQRSRLVLLCDLNQADPYQKRILDLAGTPRWQNRVTVTGFLSPVEVGKTLAAVDAVVLPFPDGGGSWSTSAQAVMAQGTFLIATSVAKPHHDSANNVSYCQAGDIAMMHETLYSNLAVQARTDNHIGDEWEQIANQHLVFFQNLCDATARAEGKKKNIAARRSSRCL